MNLPNKITMSRIFLSIFIIVLLLFPIDAMGIVMPKIFVNETIVVDINYNCFIYKKFLALQEIPIPSIGNKSNTIIKIDKNTSTHCYFIW